MSIYKDSAKPVQCMDVDEDSDKNLDLQPLRELNQGFSYLSKVETRGLLNLGKKHLDHQNWENLMMSKTNGSPL